MRSSASTWSAFALAAAGAAASGAAGAAAGAAGAAGAAAGGLAGAASWAIAIPKPAPMKSAPINIEAIRFMPRPLPRVRCVLIRCDNQAVAPIAATVKPRPQKPSPAKVPRILRNPACLTLAGRTAPGLDQAFEGAAQFGVFELRQFNRVPGRARHRAEPRARGAAAEPPLHEAQVADRVFPDACGQPRENLGLEQVELLYPHRAGDSND